MSDNPFDPAAYPEEVRPLIEQAKQQYEEAQKAAARYEGINADPETLRQALTMHQQYTDPVRSEAYRTDMARTWGLLQEGQSLDDLRNINAEIGQYRTQQDPFASMPDPDEITPEQFLSMLDTRYASPAALDDRLKAVEEKFTADAEKREMQNDLRALDQQQRALWKNLDQQGVEVSDWEKGMVQAVLENRLKSDLVDGNNFHTAYEDAYNALRTGVDARAAELMKSQRQNPRTRTETGATPGATTPVTDMATAMAAIRERMFVTGVVAPGVAPVSVRVRGFCRWLFMSSNARASKPVR